MEDFEKKRDDTLRLLTHNELAWLMSRGGRTESDVHWTEGRIPRPFVNMSAGRGKEEVVYVEKFVK